MDNRNIPLYASLNGELASPLPYRFEEALYFNFVIQADMGKLQKVCDEWINKPSNFNVVVSPLTNYVILTFASYPSAFSENKPPHDFGVMNYKEMVVTLVTKTETGPCGLGGTVYSLLPFLFLNRPRAIAAGREVFCLPKVHGDVEMPRTTAYDPTNPEFSCGMVTLPQFNPDSQARFCKLLRVSSKGIWKAPGIAGTSNTPMEQIESHVYEELKKDPSISADTAKTLSNSGQLKFINLRQWRNFDWSKKSIRKAVFEYYGEQISMMDGGPLLGNFSLDFPEETEMFPLKRDLGLYPQIKAAFWYKWNFTFVLGENLWASGGGRQRKNPGSLLGSLGRY